MLETALFYLFSFGILLSALGVVLSRSAMYSVLCLVSAMGLMAGLFVLLKAFLVATILVLVYAGAILVLFLFVVMMTDIKKSLGGWEGFGISKALAVVAGGTLFWQTFSVIRTLNPPAAAAAEGTAQNLGRLLFRDYLLPFELTSFLLLAAVVSVVVLAKKD